MLPRGPRRRKSVPPRRRDGAGADRLAAVRRFPGQGARLLFFVLLRLRHPPGRGGPPASALGGSPGLHVGRSGLRTGFQRRLRSAAGGLRHRLGALPRVGSETGPRHGRFGAAGPGGRRQGAGGDLRPGGAVRRGAGRLEARRAQGGAGPRGRRVRIPAHRDPRPPGYSQARSVRGRRRRRARRPRRQRHRRQRGRRPGVHLSRTPARTAAGPRRPQRPAAERDAPPGNLRLPLRGGHRGDDRSGGPHAVPGRTTGRSDRRDPALRLPPRGPGGHQELDPRAGAHGRRGRRLQAQDLCAPVRVRPARAGPLCLPAGGERLRSPGGPGRGDPQGPRPARPCRRGASPHPQGRGRRPPPRGGEPAAEQRAGPRRRARGTHRGPSRRRCRGTGAPGRAGGSPRRQRPAPGSHPRGSKPAKGDRRARRPGGFAPPHHRAHGLRGGAPIIRRRPVFGPDQESP